MPVFHDDLTGLARVLVVAPLAYLWLVFVLRVTGKRTLAQLNAFDFVITVALGSTLATVVLSGSVALAEGATALALLGVLQFVVAWLSSRVRPVRSAVTSAPTVLLRGGQPLRDAMRRERITEQSLLATVRGAGLGGLEQVAAVVLETNGSLSVIARDQLGSGSALADTSDAT